MEARSHRGPLGRLCLRPHGRTRRKWLESTPHVERGGIAGTPRNGKMADPYRLVFDMNPQPMWIWDVDNLQFLAVNDAAVLKYEYSRPEFLSLKAEAIFSSREIASFIQRHRTDV